MEVDDWEPEWLTEEGGYKLSDSLPLSQKDSSMEDWALQLRSCPSPVLKSSRKITWHDCQVIHLPTPPFVK